MLLIKQEPEGTYNTESHWLYFKKCHINYEIAKANSNNKFSNK